MGPFLWNYTLYVKLHTFLIFVYTHIIKHCFEKLHILRNIKALLFWLKTANHDNHIKPAKSRLNWTTYNYEKLKLKVKNFECELDQVSQFCS